MPSTSFGLSTGFAGDGRMAAAHQHDDLEFNVSDGDLEYDFEGRAVRIPARHLAVFWAARPHRLLSEQSPLAWMTVPLPQALSWAVRSATLRRLLSGEVFQIPADGALDLRARIAEWQNGVSALAAPELRRITELEIEAFIRRMGMASIEVAGEGGGAAHDPRSRHLVAEISAYISENSTRALPVAEIASSVHLSEQHAMRLFRQVTGTTIGDYVVQCRVARAQNLLLTTVLPIDQIGEAAGFRSTSQFFDWFRRRTGQTPARYRAAMTNGGG